MRCCRSIESGPNQRDPEVREGPRLKSARPGGADPHSTGRFGEGATLKKNRFDQPRFTFWERRHELQHERRGLAVCEHLIDGRRRNRCPHHIGIIATAPPMSGRCRLVLPVTSAGFVTTTLVDSAVKPRHRVESVEHRPADAVPCKRDKFPSSGTFESADRLEQADLSIRDQIFDIDP